LVEIWESDLAPAEDIHGLEVVEGAVEELEVFFSENNLRKAAGG